MSQHTQRMAVTLGWVLLPIAVLFGALLFQDGHPSEAHGKWELAFVGGLFLASILCIAAPALVPWAIKVITAWKGGKPHA